jgi:hypothetical protein
VAWLKPCYDCITATGDDMKAYLVEWWDEKSLRYQQEYYTSVNFMAHRVLMLEKDVPNSDVSVSTINICTDE